MTKAVLCLTALLVLINFHCRAQLYDASEIFNKNRTAVVRIEVYPPSNAPNKNAIVGTGFIISPDGFVVTAKHLLGGYEDDAHTPIKLFTTAVPGAGMQAEPFDLNFGQDIALLKLPDPSTYNLSVYPTVQRGDARSLAVGDPLYLISYHLGGPIGINTISLVSNTGGGAAGIFLWEVSDGATNGSSGAPIFNKYGHVVGVLKGGVSGTPVNYMYPEYILEPYAGIANWQHMAEPIITKAELLNNVQTNPGSRALTVSFKVPNTPLTKNSDLVRVNIARKGVPFPTYIATLQQFAGKWQPGDEVKLTMEIPSADLTDHSLQMVACVGTVMGCVLSDDILGKVQQ